VAWLQWALVTVVCWGVYGILLHLGAVGMVDPVNGRIKAFLWVGLAYFLVAVLLPLGVLLGRGVSVTDMPPGASAWSLVAGVVGAVGAFGVLMAFGNKGNPAVVMALVFAGAPVVNALVAVTKDGAWGQVRWPFLLGIALAAAGGGLVTWSKPAPPPHAAKPAAPPAKDVTG
jgi:hypothetical protein